MKRLDSAALLSLATLATLAGCSGGGGTTGDVTAGGDFIALKTDPTNGGNIFLNDPIAVDFSTDVDLDSASLSTMTFTALDQLGNPNSELVAGNFHLGTTPGDLNAGRRLLFVPHFATNNQFSNGGFKAGRTYLVQLVGGESQNGTVLRNTRGKGLATPTTFSFTTKDGTQPAQLYRNPKPGGPRRTLLEVSTATDLQNVPLGLFGAPPLEVRLHFDQALNPHDGNVPVNFDTNPLVRQESLKGRVYLEYKDPVYDNPNLEDYTWIPADVELEVNGLDGAVLLLRPVGVLPNNATIRIIVENTLEDISGESNVADLAYNRVFGTFQTESAYGQQWNGIAEDFTTTDNLDLAAVFPESQAEIGAGFVKAGFAFEGKSTSLEYQPTAQEVVLNTAFTQIVPASGLPFTVSGGVFNFRNVTIPQGVTVVGQGPNPMVWLCSGDFTVSGTLSVKGGNGARVDTLNSANFAKAGGVGVCGGGNGGDGTPSATQRDLRGGTGRGPLQEAGTGGAGGYLACNSGCYTGSGYNGSGGGSGGGGGTLSTQGDPNWRGAVPTNTVPNVGTPATNTSFQQRFGYGGAGCSGGSGSRTGFLRGGEPGPLVFTDSRADNNFWGSAVRLSNTAGNNLRIVGELSVPVGGGGGGGGGDTSPGFNCTLTGNDPKNDYSGGGGGGGGGVLIVKALGKITINGTGKIVADGGNGGGGEQVGACGEAGGGGGGAGGMVVLMSATSIDIVAHGSATTNRYVYGAPTGNASATHPFLRDDYSFAISADGGVCLTGGFGSVNVTNKYPANGQSMLAGTTYDGEPLGGLGGMGIVQLMVPPGDNLTDGTNTRLDDNINFYLGSVSGTLITGAGKRQLLAWRGFQNAAGTFVDENNVATDIGTNEGDIRPSPALLPVPFAPQSRVRSNWIDTGASQRRALAAADGQPRGLVTAGGAVVGPVYEFAGLFTGAAAPGFKPGYVDYQLLGATSRILYPTAVSPVAIASTSASASYLGKPAYRVTLANGALGTEANRYVQYEAELLNSANSLLASFRILSHTDSELLLDPSTEVLPADAARLQVRTKFFKVVTNGSEGLGPVNVPQTGTAMPISNVRIGFAFCRDPQSTAAGNRYPASEQAFEHDLQSAAFQAYLANGAPRYVQWDVTFDMGFAGLGLTPTTPRPELRFLRLPFRF